MKTIKLPDDLYANLKIKASEDNRSLANYISHILSKHGL